MIGPIPTSVPAIFGGQRQRCAYWQRLGLVLLALRPMETVPSGRSCESLSQRNGGSAHKPTPLVSGR